MRELERRMLRSWVDSWKDPHIVKLRAEQAGIDPSNLADMLNFLDFPTSIAIALDPPEPTSGLIEMQRLLAKLKNEAS